MKGQIKELQDLVQQEKRSLSDKVSAELDYTLKQAVREKVETKQQLEAVNASKDKLQREYDDLVDMYNSLKQAQKQNEELNEQSQKIIADLEAENKLMKGEKETLGKANIEATQKMDAAFKNHDDVKAAFLKLDEARFVLNRIMGPGGTMAENERKMYLSSNLAEHDRLVRNSKDRGNNQLTASANINPIHSVQGAAALNPSKAYFGQAGIAGNNNIGLPSPG
jgi:chromosome segregation ATPase